MESWFVLFRFQTLKRLQSVLTFLGISPPAELVPAGQPNSPHLQTHFSGLYETEMQI